MNPPLYLGLVLALTATALLLHAAWRWGHTRQLLQLARAWRMHYVYRDRLQIARRIGDALPMPGASDIKVIDLLYRTAGDRHQYLFTIEFGVGVLTGKRRLQQVGACTEPVRRGLAAIALQLSLAPMTLPVLQQYQLLHDEMLTINGDGLDGVRADGAPEEGGGTHRGAGDGGGAAETTASAP